ncbi:MAG: Fe-S-containing hydro-lyase [Candidatus Eiseniibacteriota bacterium]|nr:MAG: Fe-S-containing hydro-lyase [Candidatus Eisenbacteria bacterium]
MKRISAPLTDSSVEDLRAGDEVLISGTIYTARDAAHKRLVELLKKGENLPFEIGGQIIYYAGPTPTRPGEIIGSAGPTTSYRMDPYAPLLIEHGLKGMIGKGQRTQPVLSAMKKFKAVYFAAVGGAGALISRAVKSSSIVAYEDLGPEAVRKLEVADFPAIVAQDCHGGDLFVEGVKKYSRSVL